ncbi:MAG: 4Fe-4S dicluster domain-containing protein [Dehalococcoidales bacterium]
MIDGLLRSKLLVTNKGNMLMGRKQAVPKILIVNPVECTGCGACEMEYSMRNVGEFDSSRARIQIISLDPDFFRLPVVCLQCYKPPCAEICPTEAITRDEATGIVRVSKEKRNGCRMCEEAYPFLHLQIGADSSRPFHF